MRSAAPQQEKRVLGPLGMYLAPGPDIYVALMRNLAGAPVGCLSASG
jgi:ABC-type Zn2+ transport system substrate-binding protein/surface adhesin